MTTPAVIASTDSLTDRPPRHRLGSIFWRALWFTVAPAVLTGVYMRFALPMASQACSAFGYVLAYLRNEQFVPLSVGLFLVFGMLFRYWRHHLPGARWLAATDEPAAPVLRSRKRSQLIQAVVGAALAALFALFLRGRVIAPVSVLSSSMLPGLTPRDLLLANRLAYRSFWLGAGSAGDVRPPKRGDIIVFQSPETPGGSELIKRVIGLPGDSIAMRGARPVINGWEVPTCDVGFYLYVLSDGAVSARLLVEFLEDRAYLVVAASSPRDFPTPYEVQPGEVFVLGDNRNNSSDSRAWNDGHGRGVELERIDGQVKSFLLGARRDGHGDVRRLFESTDAPKMKMEGIDVSTLNEKIAACLADWPKDTHVPARGAHSNAPPGAPLEPIKGMGQ